MLNQNLNLNRKNLLIIGSVAIFIISAGLLIAWGKHNTEEYNKKLDKYWHEYAKYCEAKGEKLVKHTYTRRGTKTNGTIIVGHEGSCKK